MSAILHDNLICFGVNSQGKVKSIYYIYIYVFLCFVLGLVANTNEMDMLCKQFYLITLCVCINIGYFWGHIKVLCNFSLWRSVYSVSHANSSTLSYHTLLDNA